MAEDYNIYDLGFDKQLSRDPSGTAALPIQSTQSGSSYNSGLFNPIDGVTQSGSIATGQLTATLQQAAGRLFFGKTTFADTTTGYILGIDDSNNTAKFHIGDATSSLDWNVTTANTLTIKGSITATTGTIGGFDIGSDYIRDAANSMGLASTVTGGDDVRFWAGATFANRATAPFYVTEAGAFTATSVTINNQTMSGQDMFGDGSDGAVVISGNTTLSRDMFYTNLTVNAGFTLTTAGYRIFCTGTLTVQATGIIENSGTAGTIGGTGDSGGGSPGAGGAAGTSTSGSVPGSTTSGAGGAGGNSGGGASFVAGTAGTNATKGLGVAGGGGGAGVEFHLG